LIDRESLISSLYLLGKHRVPGFNINYLTSLAMKNHIKTYNAMKIVKFTPAKLIGLSFLLLTSLYSVSRCAAQDTPPRSLLALSKGDHVLAIIDPGTLKIVARVPVGTDPHEVEASSDGKTAYVSIYGGGSLHELDVIDLVAQKALSPIDTRPLMGPHGLMFAAGKLWFTAEGSKVVGRFDPQTNKFDWVMGTGQDRTHMVYATPDGKHVYTTNVSSATVSILTDSLMKPHPFPNGFTPPPHEDWVQTVIPVGKGSEGFDVSPDGHELWTAGAEDGTISIINIGDKKLVDKIDAKVNGANRLKFTPDGKLVLISSLRTGDLFIYDAALRKEIKRINIGHGGAGILVDDDNSRAFIGCTGDNYVAVVDLKTFKVIGHIDINGADGLAWAARH
jgi:DNA-binding beta-propeller fold protein YncE